MPSEDSKKNFALMRDKILSKGGKDYWKSVEEFVDGPEFEEFVKREYPNHAEEWENSLSRRNFVKFMGASLAFAGLSGCVIQPAEKIVPYVRPQEDILPGKPLFFATAMSLGGVATGLLAKSFDGRPIKIEGNPEHPGSLGTTDVLAQASILGLYDPDRSQEITYRGTPKTWQNFMNSLRAAIEENRQDGGAGVRFLTGTVTSPTLQAQFRQIATELPNSRWFQYEPVNNDNEIAGARMAFGSPTQAVYKFDKAERILALDADLFSGFNVRYINDLAKGRRVSEEKKQMTRIYAAETTTTLLGTKADHRLALKPSQMTDFALAMAGALGVSGATARNSDNAAWIAAASKDLLEHKGRSIVVAGQNQPAAVHALASAMNAALGNVGQTVTYIEPLSPYEKTQAEQLAELIGDIDAGRVKMLVILGGNPVYNTPADLKLSRERMEKVPLRVHVGEHVDETGELAHWHVAETNYLEAWSDSRAYDGTATLVQPLIQPLYDNHSIHEVVQLFFAENFDKKAYDIVKGYWQTQNMTSGPVPAAAPAARVAAANTSVPAAANISTANSQPANAAPVQTARPAANANANTAAPRAAQPAAAPAPATFEDRWRKAVHDGYIANSAPAAKSVTPNTAFISQISPAASSGLEIAILPDPSVYDGRFTNNGWLQELPNPLTKVTWENVALISPRTAERLNINQARDKREISGGERGTAFLTTRGNNMSSDTVTLTFNGGTVEKPVPMWISPGQPDDVITIFMGYGRTRAGRVGTGLGYNAFDVMQSKAMNFGMGDIKATGEKANIVSTQIHFNMEGRDILRVWDIGNLENELEHGKQPNEYDKSMYPTEQYQEQYAKYNKWGMSIDLNSCVGCNACVIACQSENNIPVVGKEQVERNREMHWLRIDTYYGGDDINNPRGPHFQPVLCQQCEQAPCEVVCPVTATVHSAEGLNDMVYNRCVGTRYCSNNCPYKVRRFNFLLYQDWDTPQYKLMRNPEVTVRSRGVMEKCTYCTQRIAAARIESEKDGRKIADGEVLTACQSICPTNAIIFGDMNDPASEVARVKKDARNYNLLNELNTQPRTTYMADLRNQNPEMPDYVAPKVYEKKSGEHGATTPAAEGH